MCHKLLARVGTGVSPVQQLLLFLGRGLLACRLFGCHLLRRGLRRFGFGFHLSALSRGCRLRLGYFLRKLRSGELPAVKSDFGDAYRGKLLTMAAQFFVLLLAFVVEDQDLLFTSLLDDFTYHACSGLRFADLAGFRRNRQHVAEFDLAVGAGALAFHSNHIAGRHPVLFSTGADDRVHTYASVTTSRSALWRHRATD